MVDQKITTFFNEIYDRTYDKVIRYVISKCGNTSDIADIVQEIYLELYSVIVKKGKGYIKNEEAFLMQLTKAKVYKHYSLTEKLRQHIPLHGGRDQDQEPPEMEKGYSFTVDEAFINSITMQEVWELLKGKPQEVQKVFYLYYYCGLKLGEIGAELNMSESNVKHKLYRTLGELRMFYGKEDA